jgi:hypothetical protein
MRWSNGSERRRERFLTEGPLAGWTGLRVSEAHEIAATGSSTVLATADANGQPQCSYKGGDPGFVQIVDETTVAFPVYDDSQRSVFVPRSREAPPVPDWKRDPWFEGTLPVDDPAHDLSNPSASSIPRF